MSHGADDLRRRHPASHRPAGGGPAARYPRLTLSPLVEPTYTVSQLCGEIRDLLGEVFPAVWVAGEFARCKQGTRGHVYFELIEKGEHDSIVGKLDAVIWNADFQRVKRMLAATGQRLADGVQIRCRGNLDFYGAGGRLQLTIREVDPAFTLGQLELRRRETLAALEAAGLMARNRALALPELPLALALVTSEGSAAYHDFLSGLRESGYGFRVLFVHASVQGRDSEREVVSALRALAGIAALPALPGLPASNAMRIDCAVLIRGGGSKTDLAAFDSRAIAEAIALAPFPVLTGLGHEIDRSIADLVAHTALKTPTKVAEFLVERVARLDDAVEELRRALRREALAPLARAREALGLAERGVSLARLRLAGAGAHVEEHARTLARLGRSALRAAVRRSDDLRSRLAVAAPRGAGRAEQERRRRAERVWGAARGHLRAARATLQGMERLAAQLDPQRTLERGFSITRDAGGRLLRHPAEVTDGALLISRLAGGLLRSRVQAGEGGEALTAAAVTARRQPGAPADPAADLPASTPADTSADPSPGDRRQAPQRPGRKPAKPAAPGSQIAFEFQPGAPGKPHEEEGR
ncbi:MAG TPA: exodeoxyribonuclease VII large subunit [Thermoanaerobaculia bacterium]